MPEFQTMADASKINERARKPCAGLLPYLPGGLRGRSAQRRAMGFSNGSKSLQFIQTYRSRRCRVPSGARFIGLPHNGQGFRTGWSAADI